MMTPEKMEKLQKLMNTKIFINQDTGETVIQQNNINEDDVPPEIKNVLDDMIESTIMPFLDELRRITEREIIENFQKIKNNLTPSEVEDLIDATVSDLYKTMTDAGEPSDKVEEFVEHVRDMLSNS